MKSTNRLIWSLLVVFGLTQFASAQSVPKALLKQDLAYIVETVSEMHPALIEAEMQQALTTRAQNGGGNSGVVNALVKHLPVVRHKSFSGSVRFSQTVLVHQQTSTDG